MRTRVATIIGLALFGILGLRAVEADVGSSPPIASTANIRVREVRQQMQDEGLLLVYELQNASLDRWILHRVEVHVFNKDGQRIELLRPGTTLTQLQRGDVDFIRTRIPPEILPEARHLQVHLFVQEYGTFPAANPGLADLVYPFALKHQTTPRALQAREGTLRVESAGMVEWEGGPRAILLRLINQGHQTLSKVILVGEITGTNGPLRSFRLPVTPTHLTPGAEAYVSIPVPKRILEKAKGISLQAIYLKEEKGNVVRYVENLEIRGSRGLSKTAGLLEAAISKAR